MGFICALLLVLTTAVWASESAPDPHWNDVRQAWFGGNKVDALQLVRSYRIEAGRPLAIESLSSSSAELRAGGIRTLRALGAITPEQVSLIRDRLTDPSLAVLTEAIAAAAETGDDAALPQLIGLAQSSSSAAAAIAAVTVLVPNGRPNEPEKWSEWYRQSRDDVLQKLRAAEPALASGDQNRTIKTIRELSLIRVHRDLIIARLVPLLRSANATVAGATTMALRNLGGPDAQRALRSGDPAAAVAGTSVLGSDLDRAGRNSPWVLWAVWLSLPLIGLALMLFLRSRTGRMVKLETERFLRKTAQQPGLAGMTARMVRRTSKTLEHGTRTIQRAAQRISWGGK